MRMYLFSKNNANAKVNQIQTNPNFLVGGSNKVSKTSNPKIIPNVAPKLQKMMECHSNAICIQKMVNAAAVIPKYNKTKFIKKSSLKPRYNEPRYSEFNDIVKKNQLPF